VRIKWNKCDPHEIAVVLSAISDEYEMEIGNVNIYFNLVKNNTTYSIYDLSCGKEAFIEVNKNVLIKKR